MQLRSCLCLFSLNVQNSTSLTGMWDDITRSDITAGAPVLDNDPTCVNRAPRVRTAKHNKQGDTRLSHQDNELHHRRVVKTSSDAHTENSSMSNKDCTVNSYRDRLHEATTPLSSSIKKHVLMTASETWQGGRARPCIESLLEVTNSHGPESGFLEPISQHTSDVKPGKCPG